MKIGGILIQIYNDKNTALPIIHTYKNKLKKTNDELIIKGFSFRRLKDMQDVVLENEYVDDRIVYFMYRDVKLLKDERTISDQRIRFDITIIPSFKIGREFIKTAGHYHPQMVKVQETYPEIYEVVKGEAHFLLQRRIIHTDEVDRVILIKAKEKEKVFIPSGYGHITINPIDETLILANWVSSQFSSIYEPIQRKKGGAFFETVEGFLPNKNYKNKIELELLDKPSGQFSFYFDAPLYSALYENELIEILNGENIIH